MPLLWNHRVKHLLAHNCNLAKSILFSNLKKFSKNKVTLELMDGNICELEQNGIIQKIFNLPQFLKKIHLQISFLICKFPSSYAYYKV